MLSWCALSNVKIFVTSLFFKRRTQFPCSLCHRYQHTFIGALADGTKILPPSINEPGKWIHVSLTPVTPDGTPWAMVYKMESVLNRKREITSSDN